MPRNPICNGKSYDAAAPYLSDAFVAQNFEFRGKVISGTKEMKPRWKRAVATVDGALGEAVGQMYVENYFPAAAKERMVKLVANLQKALGERIQALTWMSEETKAKALEKLAAIYVKVGYPDKWRDYSALEIKNDSYWVEYSPFQPVRFRLYADQGRASRWTRPNG